jgi:DNA polymerase-1
MDLIPQFDLIREAAEAYGIHQLEAPNFEADDVIATLVTMALKEGVSANILLGDKDLMQLITPEYVPY